MWMSMHSRPAKCIQAFWCLSPAAPTSYSPPSSPSLCCYYSHFHPSLRAINNAKWSSPSSVCTHTKHMKTHQQAQTHILENTNTQVRFTVWFIEGHCKGLLKWTPLSCRQAHLQTSIIKAGGLGGPRVTPMGCPRCQQDAPQTFTAFHKGLWQQTVPPHHCSTAAVSQSFGGWRKEQRGLSWTCVLTAERPKSM